METRVPAWVAPTVAVIGLVATVGGSYVVQRVQNEARNGAQDALILVLQNDVENLKSTVDCECRMNSPQKCRSKNPQFAC
jgi:hypothetical protein